MIITTSKTPRGAPCVQKTNAPYQCQTGNDHRNHENEENNTERKFMASQERWKLAKKYFS